jgi:L-seryl-tRNA(Ser) seleniumtransferase
MPDRRGFLKLLSSTPIVGSLLPASLVAAAGGSRRDYFKELGVKPFINAAGTYTTLTASLMPPEVVQAIEYASKQYVRLQELQDAAGKRIAELIGCEAAMVTSGAAGALTCGTAACMTGKNQDFIRRLPDTTGMKTEVVIQKSHRYGYDHAIRNCGTKFIEVETAAQLESAINPNTVMMMWFNANEPAGQIKAAEFIALGKKHNIPTFNDAAADTPPLERLSMYTKMGFDLVTFSGGKGIRGPQSAGLLLGRRDLIEAARLNTSPYSDSIGRGMKVNKEELLAMMVAVEVYVKKDHAAEWKEWEKRCKTIMDAATSVKGVQCEVQVPEIANHVPHIHITWDREKVKIAPREVAKQLRSGEPSIEPTPGPNDRLVIGVWMMQQGDDKVVARRVKEILKSAQA